MSLITNLKGRIRNTSLSKNHALFPFFEAVVNSIHAIEDRKNFDIKLGKISVKITRLPIQNYLIVNVDNISNNSTPNDIDSIMVTDNGIGFTDDNLNSFLTLDSSYKENKACRGIGRLLWLKVFNTVSIKSTFEEDQTYYDRSFTFDIDRAVTPSLPKAIMISKTNSDNKTTVTLSGINTYYKNTIPKKLENIAQSLLEHCLWYFIRDEGCPNITLEDEECFINLHTLFTNYTLNKIDKHDILVAGIPFKLNFIKSRNTGLTSHSIFYCAADRVVRKVDITNKIPGLYRKIYDDEGQFSYLCFVSSDFLDIHVRADRTDFDLNEKSDNPQNNYSEQLSLINQESISLDDITNHIFNIIEDNLKVELSENLILGKKRIDDFINNTAPKYKPLINIDNNISTDPDISDKDLDIFLHKRKSQLEHNIISEGYHLSSLNEAENFDEYQSKFNEYIKKISALKMSDLAQYITNRKVVLDFLDKMIKMYREGKYHKEEEIHQLIMPMRSDNSDISFLDSNLWLIDDRLTFFNYIASDKTLKSIPLLDSTETKEPDILGINIYDNPLLVSDKENLPLATINVIEIKRPMRDDYKQGETGNPIDQVLSYVKKIRAGNMKTKEGRIIPESNSIPAFCYILADITPSLKDRANDYDMTETYDKMGYFGFHSKYNTYIEIISYDKLITAAKERNAAFFNKLGI